MQEMRQRVGGALGHDLAGVQRLGASVVKRYRGIKGRFPAPSDLSVWGPQSQPLETHTKTGEKGVDPEGSHPVHADCGIEHAAVLKGAFGRLCHGRGSRRGKFWAVSRVEVQCRLAALPWTAVRGESGAGGLLEERRSGAEEIKVEVEPTHRLVAA